MLFFFTIFSVKVLRLINFSYPVIIYHKNNKYFIFLHDIYNINLSIKNKLTFSNI